MNTRTLNVTLVDQSAGIKKDENRLIARYTNILTTKTDEQVKMNVLASPMNAVTEKLEAHNSKRAKLIDEDILNRTGNEVKLREIELEDVTWLITQG